MSNIPGVSRRAILAGAVIGASASLTARPVRAAPKANQSLPQFAEPQDPRTIPAPPPQVPVTEGFVDVDGTRLYYWDTGGKGETIILEHANTGSALSWPYQQPALARAGYRVIGYSRRGAHRSASLEQPTRHQVVKDLDTLANSLKVDRFHLVGIAAGGFVTTFYGLAHPDRVISAVIACSRAGVNDPVYDKAIRDLMPPRATEMLHHEFIELSSSYRMGNPAGTKRWIEVQKSSLSAFPREQPAFSRHMVELSIGWEQFATYKPRLHLISGDADLYTPPIVARMLAEKRPGTGLTIVGEAGHCVQWEQPEIFNKAVLDFMKA